MSGRHGADIQGLTIVHDPGRFRCYRTTGHGRLVLARSKAGIDVRNEAALDGTSPPICKRIVQWSRSPLSSGPQDDSFTSTLGSELRRWL
jgi:hypothetical protein